MYVSPCTEHTALYTVGKLLFSRHATARPLAVPVSVTMCGSAVPVLVGTSTWASVGLLPGPAAAVEQYTDTVFYLERIEEILK
jgi:hypothetical protein